MRKKSWYRSPAVSETWTQDDMNGTWTFDAGFVAMDKWKDYVKADARNAQERAIDRIRDLLRGASGKFPQLDLLRIWDWGQSGND